MTQDILSLPGRQLAWTVAGLMLALFLAMLNQLSLTTAMPRIIAEFGGFDRYAWASSAYLVTATVSVPIAGRLAASYGCKYFLMLGLLVFIVGSFLAGMSGTMSQLIAFRGVQGLGGGIIVVCCSVAIVDLFPADRRRRIQGLAVLVFGLAAVTGPPLGGFITDRISWNWVLLINIPAGLPILLLLAYKFPRLNPGQATAQTQALAQTKDASQPLVPTQLDYLGMLTLTLAVVSLLLSFSWAGKEGGGDLPVVLALLALGLALGALFVRVELKSRAPIMPVDLFRNRAVAASAALNFLAGFGLYGAALFAPLFLQVILGATGARSGGVLVPMMLGIVFGGILSGLILSPSRANYRSPAVLSAAAISGGLLLMTSLDKETGLGQAMVFLAIAGLGIGGALATANAAVQHSVPSRMLPAATSTLQFYRFLSGTLGLAFLGSVLNMRFSTRLDGIIPEPLRNSLNPDFLDRIKQNLRILLDPDAPSVLAAGLFENGVEGTEMLEQLVPILNEALVGAVQDVFIVIAAVTVVAVFTGILLKQADAGNGDRGPIVTGKSRATQ